MVSIFFEHDREAWKIYQLVLHGNKSTEIDEWIRYIPGKGLDIEELDENLQERVERLSWALQKFITAAKVFSWIEGIIRAKFYYQDQHEIDQIAYIARSIYETSETYQNNKTHTEDRIIIAEHLRGMLLSGVSFSFDSFATFRLKGRQEALLPVVEQAIDEYKLEQDYQNFIQTLREYMCAQTSKLSALHLLHDGLLHFYTDSFKKLESGELFKFIDRKLLSENPMYIDSGTIAPLISIAPQKLFVYTDELESGLIQTITRIFEERSVLKSKKSFFKEKAYYERLSNKNKVL
ncbi:sporulation protein YtxC [Peribacillus kribbensis]|uniref:sporulation protein YtxC n=1 Tax=Peribacillus kribbensis TaxID=356658 RepID=UPI00040C5502|nr:sporulation protein YtxC [Peribacillus kribbensis]